MQFNYKLIFYIFLFHIIDTYTLKTIFFYQNYLIQNSQYDRITTYDFKDKK